MGFLKWAAPVILALAFVACGGDDDGPATTSATSPTASVTRATGSPSVPAASPTTDPGALFDFAKATKTASGLAYIDLKEGTGSQPRINQTVAVRYTGSVAATGKVFDSTADGPPASFALTQVIRGFAEGILSMREGGTRILYLPAAIAYGDRPPAGSGIPAGADLIFEVELVSVK